MRLQELVNENRKLNLALFWKKYNCEKLRKRISVKFQRRIQCKCHSCCVVDKSLICNCEEECSVEREFVQFVEQHGFSVAKESLYGYDKNTVHATYDDEYGPELADEIQFFRGDVHFVIPSNYADWVIAGYGGKFYTAKSINDPELQKLKQLFEALQ
jgi:hypothetical protein